MTEEVNHVVRAIQLPWKEIEKKLEEMENESNISRFQRGL